MKEISLLIADSNPSFCSGLCAHLQRIGGFRVVGIAADGDEAVSMFTRLQPKMLVVDLMLPKRDGLSVLKSISAQGDMPITVATTAFLSTYISSAVGNLGVRYVMRKPCDFGVLADRLEELRMEQYSAVPGGQSFMSNNTERMVANALGEIGVPAHIKGYKYLREAIVTVTNDPDAINAVTKVLYPHVAKVYGTSANRVERDIRHAIDLAWTRGDRDALRILFNIRRKPTNSELIAIIADKLLLQIKGSKVSNF